MLARFNVQITLIWSILLVERSEFEYMFDCIFEVGLVLTSV